MRANIGLIQTKITPKESSLNLIHYHGGIIVPAKKIVCLGGGSLYFRRAIPDLLLSQDLGGSELVLYDIDSEKVENLFEKGKPTQELMFMLNH